MKKAILFTLAGFIFTTCLTAQVTIQKNVLSYFPRLPGMPANLQDAYAKSTIKSGYCTADSLVAPLQRNLTGDEKTMGTLSTMQQQQLQQGTQLANQVKTDNVDKMTENQKLEYVKNNPQLNGGNANAVAFAQKMQNDPAEKAKLQAMTPQQKMAYLQQNGMLTPTTPGAMAAAPAGDNGTSTDVLSKAKQMQSDSNMQTKNKLAQSLNDQLDANKLNAAHAQIDQQKQAELNKLPAQSGEATISGTPAQRKAIESKYMQKHLDLALSEMQGMAKTYQSLYTFLLNNDTPYNNSLMTINYGYTGTTQDKNMSTLAVDQSYILNDVNSLANYVKSIYEFGANWQAKSIQP